MTNPLKIKEWVKSQEPSYVAWEATGLLEDLDFEESYALHLKLEEMAQFLLRITYISDENDIGVLIFPIIIRAYRDHKYLIRNCFAVFSYVNSKLHLITDFRGSTDPEVEFCVLMAREISELKL